MSDIILDLKCEIKRVRDEIKKGRISYPKLLPIGIGTISQTIKELNRLKDLYGDVELVTEEYKEGVFVEYTFNEPQVEYEGRLQQLKERESELRFRLKQTYFDLKDYLGE